MTVPANRMPALRPLPIPTRGLPWHRAYYNALVMQRRYALVDDWYWTLPSGQSVRVAAGFEFDGVSGIRAIRLGSLLLAALLVLVDASAPWLLAALGLLVLVERLSPIGILLIPALIHDAGYARAELRGPYGRPAVRSCDRCAWAERSWEKVGPWPRLSRKAGTGNAKARFREV